jgi:hypothetical protein
MDGSDYSFLNPKCRSMVDLSKAERVSLVQRDVWINYPAAAKARATVKAIFAMPRNATAQCLLIYGESGMGKSAIFNAIDHDFKVQKARVDESPKLFSFEMGPEPRLHGLADVLCELLGASARSFPGGQPPMAMKMMLKALNYSGVMIDEFHNLMLVGRGEQQKVLALLRSLNGPPISWHVIGLGTMPAVNATKSDPQMQRRFQLMELQPWTESDAFRNFLATYETLLPLRLPSNLTSQDKVQYLLKVSNGSTDYIVKRLQRAAVYAIINGKERIDLECLQLASSIPTPDFDSY